MEKYDSFERMSSGLSQEERQNILNRLKNSISSPEDELLTPAEITQESDREPFSAQMKNEPLFLRVVLLIK